MVSWLAWGVFDTCYRHSYPLQDPDRRYIDLPTNRSLYSYLWVRFDFILITSSCSNQLSLLTLFNQSTLFFYLNTLRLKSQKSWSKYERAWNLKTLVVIGEQQQQQHMKSVKMTLLFMGSRSSVDRVPARCSRGHGFESCRGTQIFHCLVFLSC